MRLDRIPSDIKDAIKRLFHALDSNITVQENFGPSGAPEGQTIISRGPARTPIWGPSTVQVTTPDGTTVTGSGGIVSIQGPPGSPGEQGPPGESSELTGHYEPMCFDYEVLFSADGDNVMGWMEP